MTSRNGKSRLQTLAPDLAGRGHVLALDPDRLGVARPASCRARAGRRRSASSSGRALLEPEVGDLARLVDAVVVDRDLDLASRARAARRGRRGSITRGRRLAPVDRLLATLGIAPGARRPARAARPAARPRPAVSKRLGSKPSPPRFSSGGLVGQVLARRRPRRSGASARTPRRTGRMPIPQERIEQDRQHEDHEQRAPVADLVPHLAAEDHGYVGPAHRGVSAHGQVRGGIGAHGGDGSRVALGGTDGPWAGAVGAGFGPLDQIEE